MNQDRFKFRYPLNVCGKNIFIYDVSINYWGKILIQLGEITDALKEIGITDYDNVWDDMDKQGFEWVDGGDFFHIDLFNKLKQCTGLKDKNGTLIYEGDLVEDNYGTIYEVGWDDGGYWSILDHQGQTHEFLRYPDNCKIIGNIHKKASQ